MRLDIIGSVASGKTTLAKRISQRFNTPYYEKDNVVWKRTSSGDEKRSPEERDRCFNEIINKKDWVVEGSPRESLKESFGCCDYIIVLDEYTLVRLIRVFKRWINQRMGKEAYNSEPTLEFLWWNIKWVFEFNKIRKGLIKELNSYGEKVKRFRHSKEAYAFVVQKYGN